MITQSTQHIPVLLNEVLEGLDIQSSDIVIDATAGGGGHARAMAEQLDEKGILIAFDQDTDALKRATQRLDGVACQVHLKESNFRHLGAVLDDMGIEHIDKALFDLGWSSDQVVDPERGMSFQVDAPLTMTLKKNITEADLTAFDVVNHWAEETLADIIYAFGDERYARRIAKKIVEVREEKPIRTTLELVDVIRSSVPATYRNGRIHPATRTFQALRIVVNDEYEALKEGLDSACQRLSSGGRIAVITFHSGEDRIVKHFFREQAETDKFSLVHKKVMVPTEDEMQNNPRARSAKLRILEKN